MPRDRGASLPKTFEVMARCQLIVVVDKAESYVCILGMSLVSARSGNPVPIVGRQMGHSRSRGEEMLVVCQVYGKSHLREI